MTCSTRFVDFWDSFSESDNYFLELMSGDIALTNDDNPDVLFFSVAGASHRQFEHSIKFQYIGENVRPDFSVTDYSIGCDHLEHERYFRWPLYNLYDLEIPNADNSNRTKFCAMVVSNARCAYRNVFFNELSKFKKVDSGGRFLNNVGGPVDSKLLFLSSYKFCLAFENSSYPGYTTEKILEAKKAGCIPIYWGNPIVAEDFNREAFVNLHEYSSWDLAFKRIFEIESDAMEFERMQEAPLIIHDHYTNRNELRSWIYDRLHKKTNRLPVAPKGFKRKIDWEWIRRFLLNSWKDIINHRIGFRRVFKILRKQF